MNKINLNDKLETLIKKIDSYEQFENLNQENLINVFSEYLRL